MKAGFARVGTLVLLILALSPGLALAHGERGVTVEPLTPKPDQTITVNGELLGPNSEVEVRVIGNGMNMSLGEVKADEEGDFTEKFRLPANLKPGTYQIEATGKESATTQITVSGAPAGGTEADSKAGAMGKTPVIEQRPLGQSISLVALFGVLAALGLYFARRPVRKAWGHPTIRRSGMQGLIARLFRERDEGGVAYEPVAGARDPEEGEA